MCPNHRILPTCHIMSYEEVGEFSNNMEELVPQPITHEETLDELDNNVVRLNYDLFGFDSVFTQEDQHIAPPPTLFVTTDESETEDVNSTSKNNLKIKPKRNSLDSLRKESKEEFKSESGNMQELERGLDNLSSSGEFLESRELDPITNLEGGNDLLSNLDWKNKRRHVFILSESGKPIFSRHGNEEKLVTLFGLMQALVSVVQDSDDTIRCISIGNVKIVFLIKSPLILLNLSRTLQPISQMHQELNYYYNQVVSILTSKQLTEIYEKRRNYDLRRSIAGSERLLVNLSNLLEYEPSFLLSAVRPLSISPSIREQISNAIIQNTTKIKDIVFAVLVANKQLVTLVRMKKCFMHPMDLHLIINLIDSSESFKTVESWTPICLPKFDSTGFVHAHVSYLADDSEACLVLLTVDRDSFFILSEAKQKIVEKLRKQNCLEAINVALSKKWPTMAHVGIPEVRHFMYKYRSIAQFSMPELDAPYSSNISKNNDEGGGGKNKIEYLSDFKNQDLSPAAFDFLKIYNIYTQIHGRLHSSARPLKLLYWTGEKENWMGWITSNFELYLTFEPFTSKKNAISAVNKLLKWVKKEEEKLFIINSPTF